MKKRIIYVVIVILMIFIMGTVITKIYDNYCLKKEERAFGTLQKCQYVYNALQIIDYLEKNNIKIQDDYIKTIDELGKEIISAYKDISVDSKTLSEIIVIDEYVNYGKNVQNIVNILNERYFSEEGIFSETECDDYKIIENEEQKNIWVTQTIEVTKMLKNKMFFQKFNCFEGLQKWFNENVELYGKNDLCDENLESIFWLFLEENKIELLDYTKLLPTITQIVDEEKEEIIKNGACMTSILMSEDIRLFETFVSGNSDYTTYVSEEWRNIDSLEKMEYESGDINYIIFLNIMLNIVDNPIQNEFFVTNINRIMKENFDLCLK